MHHSTLVRHALPSLRSAFPNTALPLLRTAFFYPALPLLRPTWFRLTLPPPCLSVSYLGMPLLHLVQQFAVAAQNTGSRCLVSPWQCIVSNRHAPPLLHFPSLRIAMPLPGQSALRVFVPLLCSASRRVAMPLLRSSNLRRAVPLPRRAYQSAVSLSNAIAPVCHSRCREKESTA